MKLYSICILACTLLLIAICTIPIAMNVPATYQENTTGNASSKADDNAKTTPSVQDKTMSDPITSSKTSPAEEKAELPKATEQSNLNPTKVADQASESVQTFNATETAAPPDGRIYTGGEAPYAYTPTVSQKQQLMPIVPIE